MTNPLRDAPGRRTSSATTLVTGALGLVGRDLVRRMLQSGGRVRGVDRGLPDRGFPRDVELLTGDLRDPDVCRAACSGATAIVHAAAEQYHSGAPRWGRTHFFDRNRLVAQELTAAALRAGVHAIVVLSTDMVYGPRHAGMTTESDPPAPIGPYGRSKLAAEAIFAAARREGARVTILRPRLIIGPGRLGVLRLLFERVRAGRPVPLIGAGANRYQMVSVADVSSACLMALERPLDEVFNIGSSDPPTVAELLRGLCERAGSASRVVPTPAWAAQAALTALDWLRIAPLTPEQFRLANVDSVLDITKAERLLGWTPRDSDSEMLWQAYQSYVHADGSAVARSARLADVVPAGASQGPRSAAPHE